MIAPTGAVITTYTESVPMGAEQSGTVAVLAEKPSVARDIAKVLGANTKG